MQPLYFGTSKQSLFGVYHQGARRESRRSGFVVCYPLGHEYVRVHRALRNLAVELSEAGCDVLRFDYHGTGDSSGNGEDVSVKQCITDIDTAIEELKDMCAIQRVSLIGLRCGGTLAAMVASERRDIDALVMLDPVRSGIRYLNQLRTVHARWMDARSWVRSASRDGLAELIGFPLSATLKRELMGVNHADLKTCLARRVRLLFSGDATDDEDFTYWRQFASTLSTPGECVRVPAVENDWDDPSAVHRTVQSRDMIQAIMAGVP